MIKNSSEKSSLHLIIALNNSTTLFVPIIALEVDFKFNFILTAESGSKVLLD